MQQQQDDHRGQVRELGEHFGFEAAGHCSIEEVVVENEEVDSDFRTGG